MRELTALRNNNFQQGWCELDSHADTVTAGSNCIVLEYTNQTCQVAPYNDNYEPICDVPIVKVATAYVYPDTGETMILILNQALYIADLPRTLLNPNQMRCNGIGVDDCRKFLGGKHTINLPMSGVGIPLKMRGVISGFITHPPTKEELEQHPWFDLTSGEPWNPCSTSFQENEQVMNDREAGYYYIPDHEILSISFSKLSQAIQRNIQLLNSTLTGSSMTKEKLAKIWKIPLKAAENTIKVTTQKGIVHPLNPLQSRYRTKQSQLRYNQLGGRHGRFYSDTMFSSVKSLQGFACAQVFVNDVNFTRIYPMKRKGEAGNALLEFIRDVGIPSTLHTDNAKELTGGEWKKVASDHQIMQTLAEPYSPWQVRAEIAIRELKRGVRRMMENSKAPKMLWDFCASYVADLRSMTVTDLYSLQGRTPWEIVTGNTPDISE